MAKTMQDELKQHAKKRLSNWIIKNPNAELSQKCSNEAGFNDSVNDIIEKVNIYGGNTSFTDVILEINQQLEK